MIDPDGKAVLRRLGTMVPELRVLLPYCHFVTHCSSHAGHDLCQASQWVLVLEFCLPRIVVQLCDIIKFQPVNYRFNHLYASCLDTSLFSIKKRKSMKNLELHVFFFQVVIKKKKSCWRIPSLHASAQGAFVKLHTLLK